MNTSPSRTDHAAAQPSHFKEVPILDLTPMFGEDVEAKREFATRLLAVCSSVGFFYLKGHRVPQVEIDEMFETGMQFMHLPESQKMTASIDKHPNGYAGYSPLRSRSNSLFSGFDMTVEFTEDHPAVQEGLLKACRNQWPEGFPALETVMKAYRKRMVTLGRKLFSAFALSLHLPEGHFDDVSHDPFGSLRINYYPPQDPMTKDTDVGIFAHTDFQCFTLLAQDAVPGLEVQNDAGDWVPVPPIPGAFVINIGDLLARWSNDIFRSTPHRVLNLSGEERMSVAFFCGTDVTATIDTLPSCITQDRPKKYASVTTGRYVLERFSTYKKHGQHNDPRPASVDTAN